MTVKLLLTEPSKEITDICKSVENDLSEISGLNDLSFTVELLENFDGLSEEEKSQSIKSAVVIYRNVTETICVNRNALSIFPYQVLLSAFARAIASSLVSRDSLLDRLTRYAELGHFDKEIFADYLTCKWGFLEGLRAERLLSYGQHYVEVLDKWHDEEEYLSAMYLWLVRKGAGHV
ncbi:MAG: hypothetical protein KAJ32_05445 [Gammaproteobacteria bacterium]|nr:hypothetical protein [Gammaproteobacteria bacterium]